MTVYRIYSASFSKKQWPRSYTDKNKLHSKGLLCPCMKATHKVVRGENKIEEFESK